MSIERDRDSTLPSNSGHKSFLGQMDLGDDINLSNLQHMADDSDLNINFQNNFQTNNSDYDGLENKYKNALMEIEEKKLVIEELEDKLANFNDINFEEERAE
mmetsp:Transcript_36410/g.79384  ORF Transcript_36410/g.79384 Transcript_36410/m.79384 type:complete len:102 (-) Transcript_36410:425-730(-)